MSDGRTSGPVLNVSLLLAPAHVAYHHRAGRVRARILIRPWPGHGPPPPPRSAPAPRLAMASRPLAAGFLPGRR